MKSLLKVSLGLLFLAVTGIAAADDIRGGAVIVVPERHYHHHHHRHYYDHHAYDHHDQPRSGVDMRIGIGGHN